jgi:hypothetical protein
LQEGKTVADSLINPNYLLYPQCQPNLHQSQ